MARRDSMRIRLFLAILVMSLLLTGCEFTTQQPTAGKLNYLVIGERYYAYYSDGGYYRLSYTDSDATSVAKTIVNLAGESGMTVGTGFVMTEGEGTVYSSDYPTLDNVKQHLSDLADASDDSTLTIIFYSGHGTKPGGSLCFVKSAYAGQTQMKSTTLDDMDFFAPKDFLDEVNTIKGRKLILLDSCYSGIFADDYGLTSNKDTSTGNLWDAYFTSGSYSDIFMLTASTSATSSYVFDETQHGGVFTYFLLLGLGWKSDTVFSDFQATDSKGRVTVDSLYAYIYSNSIPWQYKYPQHVTTNGDADNLVLYSGS